MSSVFLVGTRVWLRPLERTDAPYILPWINDPDVTRSLLLHRPMNLQAEEAFIDETTRDEHALVVAIVNRQTDKTVGVAGLQPIDFQSRQAQFGIFIGDRNERGKGLGTEATALVTGYAFDTLNLHRVWLHVVEANAAAIRCYEKVGYRREGLLRDAFYREGRYWNLVSMAVLRQEFRALQATEPVNVPRAPDGRT